MRIKPALYGILVVGVFAGTAALAAAGGAWQTTGRTASGSGPGGGDGTGAGGSATLTRQSTSEIKGWMAIGDVAAAWSVALPEVLSAFDLPPATPPTTALKDLESDLFSVTSLRAWLDARAPGAAAPTGSAAP